MSDENKPIRILLNDYEQRKQRNARFSKRAYARYLGISSGRLADLLNGRTRLSVRLAQKIAEKLGISDTEKQDFIYLVSIEQLRKVDGRRSIKKPVVMIENLNHSFSQALNLYNSDERVSGDFSTIILPCNANKLAEARALIRKFQIRLAALCAQEDSVETYYLNVQLFPAVQTNLSPLEETDQKIG